MGLLSKNIRYDITLLDNKHNGHIWSSSKYEKPYIEKYEMVKNGIGRRDSSKKIFGNQKRNLPGG